MNRLVGRAVIAAALGVGAILLGHDAVDKKADVPAKTETKSEYREIYLAAGCFWGTEAFFKKIDGIEDVEVGYANGKTDNTDYMRIKSTDHAETARIVYNPDVINLTTILAYYFEIIDPTSINKQGNDVGRQYRTGIYYTDEKDLPIIEAFLKAKEPEYKKPLAVEVEPLKNFVPAEDYHQDYLDKNPGGYCHINLNLADKKLAYEEITDTDGKLVKKGDKAAETPKKEEKGAEPEKKAVFKKQTPEQLKKNLTSIQYQVTQKNGTERPFENPYWDNDKRGIYVDVTTGQPLFSSKDKFDSQCGWPSFAKPIEDENLSYLTDTSHGMLRVEVRSRLGDAHLGHIFDDGPLELGGQRYCINSAALKFIPYEDMEKEGYGDYMKYV